MATALQREVLLSPQLVARGAASLTDDPAARWMLAQPLAVRRSYVAEVVDRDGDAEELRKAWMLRQSDVVRESYVSIRLDPESEADRAPIWMLRQPDEVRESFIAEVLNAEEGAVKPEVVWMLRQPDAVRESYLAEVVLRGSER